MGLGSGLVMIATGVALAALAVAAAPFVVPALAAAACVSATVATVALAVGVGATAGMTISFGLAEIQEGFTGNNFMKDNLEMLGLDKYYEGIRETFFILSIIGIVWLAPYAAMALEMNRRAAEATSAGGVATKGPSPVSNTYGPMNKGPLPGDVAGSFRSGTYTETVLQKDTVFYRVSGGNAGEVGRYLSRTPQNGGLQSQLDLALNPQWGNAATNISQVKVPAGTVIYEGFAAPQNIAGGGVLSGGGSQIYIPEVNPLRWLR